MKYPVLAAESYYLLQNIHIFVLMLCVIKWITRSCWHFCWSQVVTEPAV